MPPTTPVCARGHVIAEVGRTRTRACRECDRARCRAYKAAHPDRMRAYRRARADRLKAAGLCIHCGQDVAITEAYCFTCLGKKDEANAARVWS